MLNALKEDIKMAMTKIRKWGNSQGVTIPKSMLDKLHWLANEAVEVVMENDGIIIKQKEPRKNIEDLFVNFDGEYKPIDIDWGKPVGKEIW